MPAFDETSGISASQQMENLPPQFHELNADARQELANGSVNDLGNGPTVVGTPQPLAARQSQTVTPVVNSLAWMRGIDPPQTEEGVPMQLRDTPSSGVVSSPTSGQAPMSSTKAHRQAGVSPGNAEAEEEDWEHPYS